MSSLTTWIRAPSTGSPAWTSTAYTSRPACAKAEGAATPASETASRKVRRKRAGEAARRVGTDTVIPAESDWSKQTHAAEVSPKDAPLHLEETTEGPPHHSTQTCGAVGRFPEETGPAAGRHTRRKHTRPDRPRSACRDD